MNKEQKIKDKPKRSEFVVHCIMCGKDFRVGDKAECGGLFSGKPLVQLSLSSPLSICRRTHRSTGRAAIKPPKVALTKMLGGKRRNDEAVQN